MALVNQLKINTYYDQFKTIDVIFTKEIIEATGLISKQVYLKCMGDFWPCVVYSTSFEKAVILVNQRSDLTMKLKTANNTVSLRMCFKSLDTGEPAPFFITAHAAGFAPYKKLADTMLMTLQFSQRPPDELINVMGRFLDTAINAVRRKEDRIIIDDESERKLRLLSKQGNLVIESGNRQCRLIDLSFSGAKMLAPGDRELFEDKEGFLVLDFEDPNERFMLKGKFVWCDPVENQDDLLTLGIAFHNDAIPMGYKMRINDYFTQMSLK